MARHGKRRIVSVADHQIRECLTELPVEALRIDESVRTALADVDIRRVGELFDLPHDDLAARYGHDLLDRIHQALGDAYETIEPIKPADPLTVIRAFDGPIRHAGIIEGTVRDLLESLIDLLTRRGKGAYELLLTLWRVDAGPMREAFRFTQATREFKHIWSMVENRLHALRIGHGVEEITLDATRTDDLHGEQTAMWGRDDDGAANVVALGRLVDCLMERLGSDAVTAIAPVESHIPERAYERVAPLAKATAPVVLSRGVQRPSLLLDRPEPVRVIALFPNGPPAWMQWRGDGLDIDAADGPERISLPWWNRKAGAARDYYTVRDARGRCIWIFRARDGQADGQWFVHGIWA
jgi:protein ImuB